MKRIINGKRYDTDKAICIGGYDHGSYPGSGDFSHWSAELYMTPRSKNYFLAGEGGAMTRFARHCADGSSCGGSKLIPIGREDALEWAERYLDNDTIEEYFSDEIEDA